jgi:hypothetical protein
MKVRDFLKSNPDVQWAYFPDKNQQIIIRFWNDDKTGRDRQLSALLKKLKLPYSIHMRKTAFFYLIQPNLYD